MRLKSVNNVSGPIASHERLFDITAATTAIRAELESGIIKSRKPNTDILSFGPTIRGAHSLTERLKIATNRTFYDIHQET